MCEPNFTCNRPKVEGAIGHKDNFYTFVMKEVQASISACIFHLILFISMALKFKIAKRKLYVGKRKGQTVFYAIQEEHPRTTWEQVEGRITRTTGITRADLRAAVIALYDIVEEELSAGRAVDLADLGSFKAVATGKMMDTFEAVDATSIAHQVVRFFPKKKMRLIAKNLSLEVLKEEHKPRPKKKAKPSKPAPSTPEQGEGGSAIGI